MRMYISNSLQWDYFILVFCKRVAKVRLQNVHRYGVCACGSILYIHCSIRMLHAQLLIQICNKLLHVATSIVTVITVATYVLTNI